MEGKDEAETPKEKRPDLGPAWGRLARVPPGGPSCLHGHTGYTWPVLGGWVADETIHCGRAPGQCLAPSGRDKWQLSRPCPTPVDPPPPRRWILCTPFTESRLAR